ncbi:MAG: hypothetical protein JJE53_01450 [Candidatus Pacebacteria bacterium]|nr:hypothetical protein [Candidatus Paceibacterota bacterium]
MKENKKLKKNGGEMNFGFEVLIFIVIIFVLWVLSGGSEKEQEGPILIPEIGQVDSNRGYEPIED